MADLDIQLRRNAANDAAHRLGYVIYDALVAPNRNVHTVFARPLEATDATEDHFLCRRNSDWLTALEDGVEILRGVKARGDPWPAG